jgi:hypothetical protein
MQISLRFRQRASGKQQVVSDSLAHEKYTKWTGSLQQDQGGDLLKVDSAERHPQFHPMPNFVSDQIKVFYGGDRKRAVLTRQVVAKQGRSKDFSYVTRAP